MKTTFKFILALSFIVLLTNSNIFAQGCVAIRSTGGIGMDEHPDSTANASAWFLNSNSRYYNSFRHFVGKKEQTQRIAQHTNVINHGYTQDLTLTRTFNNRWSVSLDVPVIGNMRSSLYEHGGAERHTTHSFGLGDIRLTTYAWLFNPVKAHSGNIQIGLGLKLPTGNYNYQDYFSNVGVNGAKRLGPVDQSIQLGDGGTGISTEVNAFFNISRSVGFYGNFYYLISPKDVNGVSSARGGTPSANSVANTSDVMSVPDQALIRLGANWNVKKFTFSAGARYECLPSHDLVGGSDGFRRPGRILNAEPGITYRINKVSIYAYVPIAIIRDRTQSEADLRTTALTGKYTQGDAAFADYAVNIGLTFRL